MRLIALTEFPELWEETLRSLSKLGEAQSSLQGPSRHDQYLFFQVLLATWIGRNTEDYFDRLRAYMQKASRESKRKTSWNNQNEDYEKGLEAFIKGLLSDEGLSAAIEPLAQKIAHVGLCNSVSQLVLKFTMPGVPDIYQGCELLDLSLVDPDNRRPVDYLERYEMLQQLADGGEPVKQSELDQRLEAIDGSLKLLCMTRLMQLRSDHAELFTSDTYHELKVDGIDASHWIVFRRQVTNKAIVVIAPRLNSVQKMSALIELDETLRDFSWREVLSGVELGCCSKVDIASLPWRWSVLYGELRDR